MQNQDGTTDIPSLTPEAEHLSTLSTLKEVREKWKPNQATLTGLFGSAPCTTSIFGTTAATSTTFSPPRLKIASKGARKTLV